MNNSKLLKINAAVVRSQGVPVVLESSSLRRPQGDELLVRSIASGNATSIAPMLIPAILYYEASGTIQAVEA